MQSTGDHVVHGASFEDYVVHSRSPVHSARSNCSPSSDSARCACPRICIHFCREIALILLTKLYGQDAGVSTPAGATGASCPRSLLHASRSDLPPRHNI